MFGLDEVVVRFRYRDYADHNATKMLALPAAEFLRRFLLHVLPPGLKRIGHFGLLATRQRTQKIERCRALLGDDPRRDAAFPPPVAPLPSTAGAADGPRPARRCPHCGSPRVCTLELLPPLRPSRASP